MVKKTKERKVRFKIIMLIVGICLHLISCSNKIAPTILDNNSNTNLENFIDKWKVETESFIEANDINNPKILINFMRKSFVSSDNNKSFKASLMNYLHDQYKLDKDDTFFIIEHVHGEKISQEIIFENEKRKPLYLYKVSNKWKNKSQKKDHLTYLDFNEKFSLLSSFQDCTTKTNYINYKVINKFCNNKINIKVINVACDSTGIN